MKVRMKVDMSGSRDGEPWPHRGETVDLSDVEGAKLCNSGIAEPVADKDADVETATVTEPAEERDEPKRRGRPPKAKTDDGD